MNNWYIDNGSLLLRLKNGNIFHPTASIIYEQKDNTSFEYLNEIYPPLTDTNIRFSELTAYVRYEFAFNEGVCLRFYTQINSEKFYIANYDGNFNDYVIYNNRCKYLTPVIEIVNSLIKEKNIKSLLYKDYIYLKDEFQKLGIEGNDKVLNLVQEIKETKDLVLPSGLNANLYPYQSGGVKWIDFMVRQKCGCVLGDEMGLGKTLQIISVIGLLRERLDDCKVLIVCPVSLLENWRREIYKFYPSLIVNIHHGIKRTGDYRELLKYDVNIMSYSSTISDTGLLSLIKWDLLVIDEAQNIKNPKANRTKAVKSIKCDIPIAVTGTPFENHMTDIWSLIDFIIPGFLGSLTQFKNIFSDDNESAVSLEKLITPLILRRRVKDVASDLPERVDIAQPIVMTEKEALLYEDCRVGGGTVETLRSLKIDKIQKLRTFCTHPYVYSDLYDDHDPISISTKYERLCEILDDIVKTKEKVVIFTSFTRMIQLMVNDIKKRFNVYTNFIDGSVDAVLRQEIVDEFEKFEGSGVLILNPKAAGTGLNITCANHVIHYNLEWNPAIEDQASARVYRRGQNKTVFVHRLYYANTIEDIINDKIQLKRTLSDNAIIGNRGEITEEEYLYKALSISPYNVN